MLKLQFRDDPERFIKLSVSTVTLGRDESNDMVIDSPSVSDFHAEITADAQHPCIVDLLSATGTFVNDRRITRQQQLKAWDVIRLGTIELEVTDPNSRRPEDWALSTESDLLASQFYTLQSHTVVGRDAACDFTIDSHLLSRRHAELIIEDDHLRVIDLDSSNGTFINGQKIKEGEARPGDELRFDRQCFIVMGPTPPSVQSAGVVDDRTMLRAATADATFIADTSEATVLDDTNPEDATMLMADDETLLFVAPPPTAYLVETGAGDVEAGRIALESEVCRVGRSQDCDIVLEDKSVSKQHAEFAFTEGAWTVRDLGSSNGVLLNEERVELARLESGDRVKLGRCEYEFSPDGSGTVAGEAQTMIYQAPLRTTHAIRETPGSQKDENKSLYRWLGGLVLVGMAAAGAILLLAGG